MEGESKVGGRLRDPLGEERKGPQKRKRFPLLPDGTRYYGVDEGDEGGIGEAARILDNLNSTYLLGREHTHLIKLILDAYMRIRKLRRTSDPRLLQELRFLEGHVMALSESLGLIQKHKPTDTPYDYIEMLRERAAELIKDHGLEKSIACPGCGKIILAYVGTEHPFLGDEKFAVWSQEVRELLEKKCECGRPKLTLEEAAKVLRLPPIGVDQIVREAEKEEALVIGEGEEEEKGEEKGDEIN